MDSLVATQRAAVGSLLSGYQATGAKLNQTLAVCQQRLQDELAQEDKYGQGLAEIEGQLGQLADAAAARAQVQRARAQLQALFGTYKQALQANNARAEALASKQSELGQELAQLQAAMAEVDQEVGGMLAFLQDHARARPNC